MSEQVQLWETYNDKGFKAKLSEFAEKDAAGNDIATSLGNRYTKGETDTLLNGKEDKIDDLATIRSNASKGATAIQGVQRNGTDLALDANSKVNVEVPVLGIQVNNADVTPDPSTKKVNLTVLDTISDGSDYPVSSKTIYTALDDIYTKAETNAAIAAAVADFGGFKVVTLGPDGKPAEQSPSTKIIYLTKDDPATKTDPYTEWICTDTTGPVWEIIGETSVDLSQYYTKTEADALLANKVTVVTGKGLSTEDYSTDEKTKLAGISAGANKVESSQTNGNIKVDGTETTVYAHPAGSENVSGLYKVATDSTGHVTSATAVVKADITDLGIPAQDTTYESKTAAQGGTDVSLVTTGEKYTWNQKYDLPVNGIPKNELAQGVQDSLDAADTALQPADIDGYWNGAVIDSGSGNVVSGVSVDSSTGRVTVTKTSIVPSDSTPLVASGNGDAGTDTEYARADHVHPAEVDIDTETFISNIMVDPQNPLLDEQGNPIVASPDVTLVSAINDTEIVAKRAREDINGESLELNLTGGLITGIGGKQLASAVSANNGALNITVGSSSPVTFTANQPDNSPVNLTIPVATSSTEGLMSVSDKVKLEGIAGGAEVNTIASISLNGTGLTPDANRNVEITVTSPSPSDASPEMDGTADAGVSTDYARADHVHPSDSTKADKVSGATDGNFAGLNANGNLVDSGSKAADFATAAQGALADTAYQKPSTGIPSTDLDQASQTSLGLADTAYQKPSTGIPSTDLDQASQTSLGLADTAVQDANYVHTDNNYTAAEKDKLGNIEAGAQVNVQADWEETNSSADSYIQNKPAIPAAQIQSDWTQADNTALDYIKNKPASVSMVPGTGISITEDQAAGTMTIASTVDTSTKADKVSGATNGNFAGLDTNGNLTDSGSKAADFATAAQGALADTAVQDASYQHTDNNYTTAEKTKLSGIEDGAQVNVQSDWTETDNTADSYIQNKPQNLVSDANYVHTDNNYTTAEQTKLAGIETGAEVNVQANWTESDTTADSYIQNKPQNLVQDANYVHTDNNYTNADQTKLTGIEDGAQVNVQANWTESDNTADSYIQNKPTLATVATTGSYNDLSDVPTPVSLVEGQGIDIQEASGQFTISTNFDPSDKADKVTSATNGNLAGLDVNGNLTDSGSAPSDFAPANVIPSDATPQNQLVSESTLQSELANFGGFKKVPGDASGEPVLPSGETPSTKIIYLTKDTSVVGSDQYREWIWDEGDSQATPPVAAHWELIGDTAMNLNGYVQFPSSFTPGNIVEFDSNNTISDSGATVSSLENVVETVKVNGTALTPDGNKAVDVTVPITEIQVNSTAVTPVNHVVDITVPAQVNADWNANSGVAEILNKPTLATVATTGDYGDLSNAPNLATVATSGDYEDLSNKPTIPAAQVNSDWNAASGVAEILNKPTFATVATSGDYDDLINKPTIPAAQVNSDWNASTGVAEILNKPTLAAVATTGDYGDLSNAPNLATVATSGDYDDLTNKPTIPAAQVNSDWNAASGVAEILNKPTIGDGTLSITVGSASAQTFTANQSANSSVTVPLASVDSSGATPVYTEGLMSSTDKEKLEGIEAGAEVNVKPDWNATVGADNEILNKPTIGNGTLSITVGSAAAQTFTANQETNESITIPLAAVDNTGATPVYTEGLMSAADKAKVEGIADKADKVTSATPNNFASLTSGGNLADSGYSANSFATAAQGALADSSIQGVTVDSGSPLTPVSGVVNIDLSGKVDVVSGKGLSTNDYTQADKDVVDNAADVIPSDATASNQLVSYDTMTAALANFIGMKVSNGTGADMHPDEQNPNTKTIYLVYDSGATGGDKYKEWIYSTTNTWTLIGDTTVDLSGYVQYPSTHTDTHLVAFGPNDSIADTGKTVADLTNSVETVSIGSGSGISPTSGTTDINIPLATNVNNVGTDGAMAGADKVKLDGIASGAQVNTVNTVSIGNGSGIAPTTGTTDINIPMATSSVDGAMSSADKGKLDGIVAGAEPNVQSDWSETDTTDDAYIANKPDIIIPQASPAALGGIAAPKYLMVVTTMPAAADIDPDTIYLVQGTYIGT